MRGGAVGSVNTLQSISLFREATWPEITRGRKQLLAVLSISMMGKRRGGGSVHHHTLKTIRAVVLGKDGVGKSGTTETDFNPNTIATGHVQDRLKL